MILYGIDYQPFCDGIDYASPFTELVRCTNCQRYGNVDFDAYECPDCESYGTLIDIEPHEVKQDG